MKKYSLVLVLLLGSQVSMVFGLGSGGIGNEVVTARTLALAGSILVPNDPGNVYVNPAMLGDMGKFNNTLGLSYYNYSAERDANGQTTKMETLNTFAPNFFLTHSFSDERFGMGIGILTPYGLETDWGETSPVRYVATKSEIKMINITPAVSYRFSNQWAIGLGADYFSTFDTSLQKKVPVDVVNFLLGVPTLGAADANSKLEGDGNQWGYHSSVMFSPNENHSFAVSYHSEVKTKIEGELEITGLSGASAIAFGGTDYRTDAKTDLFYPQNVQIGYRLALKPGNNFYANAAWYDWSSNRQLEIVLPNASAVQRSIAGAPIPLEWRDAWSVSVGVDHALNDKWGLMGGLFYEPNVYPESTFSPAVPDLDRYGASVGSTYSNEKIKVEFVYEPILLKKTTITNNIGQSSTGLASANISGDYKGFVHVLGVNLSYLF